jgi:hypothetical protein
MLRGSADLWASVGGALCIDVNGMPSDIAPLKARVIVTTPKDQPRVVMPLHQAHIRRVRRPGPHSIVARIASAHDPDDKTGQRRERAEQGGPRHALQPQRLVAPERVSPMQHGADAYCGTQR